MSSPAILVAPTVAAGLGLVNAASVDATFALIVNKINELIAAINETFDSTNTVEDLHVRLRMLAPTAAATIQETADALVDLRNQLGGGYWDPGQARVNILPLPANYIRNRTSPSGGISPSSDPIRGGRSVDRKQTFTVPGYSARMYLVRIRLRNNMEGNFFGEPDLDPANTDQPHMQNVESVQQTRRYLVPTPAPAGWPARRTVPAPVGIDFPGEINAPRVGDAVHNSRQRISYSPVREMWTQSFGNGLHFRAASPFRMWVTNGCLSRGGHQGGGWGEQFPFSEDDHANWPRTSCIPQDLILEIPCYGGSEFKIWYNAGPNPVGGGYASPRTDYPNDDDPRFPYRYRYRAGGAVQWDFIGFKALPPVTGATIDDEYGVPITATGPGGVLTP